MSQTDVSRPFPTQGTILEMEDPDNAGTWIKITNMLTIDTDRGEAETFDTTDLESSAREESPAGLAGQGVVSGTMFYSPRSPAHQALLAAHGNLRNYRITFPDEDAGSGTVRTFSGTLKTLSDSVGVGDGVRANYSITLAGALTEAPGS